MGRPVVARASALACVCLLSPLWTTPTAALEKGAKAPELEAETLEGDTVKLSALRGKVVLVDFWASWCEPCKEEMPLLDRLYAQYGDEDLVVLGVSVDRDESAMREFLAHNGVSFPVVHDAEHEIVGRYEPPKMPTSYLVGPEGVVRYINAGYTSEDADVLERKVRSLLSD